MCLGVFNLTVCCSLLLSPEGGCLPIHFNELGFFWSLISCPHSDLKPSIKGSWILVAFTLLFLVLTILSYCPEPPSWARWFHHLHPHTSTILQTTSNISLISVNQESHLFLLDDVSPSSWCVSLAPAFCESPKLEIEKSSWLPSLSSPKSNLSYTS